jgi:hypothetical protein
MIPSNVYCFRNYFLKVFEKFFKNKTKNNFHSTHIFKNEFQVPDTVE